jgi:hypothetical protein
MAAPVDAEPPINSRLFIVRTPLRVPAMTGRRSDGWRVRIPDDAGRDAEKNCRSDPVMGQMFFDLDEGTILS